MRFCGVLVSHALVGLLLASAAQARDPVLDTVIKEVRDAYNKREQPMVIFDLDGTLLDNRPRILKILNEYADTELAKVRPEAAGKIKALIPTRVEYLLTSTLNKAGVTEAAVVNNAAVFWSKRFFTDEYLKHDEPVPGTVDFVRTLYSSGARVVYLTARDAPRQLLGSVKSLRDRGFPIGIQGSELIMKPTAQTQDAIFKTQVTAYLRHYGKLIAAFDNEPANVNVYRRAFKDAAVVLFDAPHSPNPPPVIDGVHRLHSFQ